MKIVVTYADAGDITVYQITDDLYDRIVNLIGKDGWGCINFQVLYDRITEDENCPYFKLYEEVVESNVDNTAQGIILY